jgi:hypothetical protein
MDTDRYLRLQERKIKEFSGRFMNNTKWFKLFKTLSENSEVIKKCSIINIYDDVSRTIEIPTQEEFFIVYDEKGIKDEPTAGGPMLFKEIRWIEFPATWSIQRTMRDEVLQPLVFDQNLDLIENILVKTGELEIEQDEICLKVYGYR